MPAITKGAVFHTAARDPDGPCVGLPKAALDTPALLVDLDILEANIGQIAETCRKNGVSWRPHIKAHKTPEIACMTIAAGAIGVTCAKLGEAEVMAAYGIRDILIANQIVGRAKFDRLLSLIDLADPIVCVDGLANISALSDAAEHAGRTVNVAIEIDIGLKRAGVRPGAAVVALADEIARRRSLNFVGLVGWEGHVATIAEPARKAQAVAAAVAQIVECAEACRAAGHDIKIVSCGGTGSYPYCTEQPGVTEVEVGGAIFSDMHYRTNYNFGFPCALSILTTVTSRPNPTRIIADAGKKAMSGDAALPLPLGDFQLAAVRLSAEHTNIELSEPSSDPKIGDRLEFIVGYSDTTVHLHEEIIGLRSGIVEVVWRVAARGKLK